MRAKDVLLDSLRRYSGTVVFVSHDRYFIDNLATRIFEIEDGHVHVFPGNYEDYLWRKQGGASPETDSAAAPELPEQAASADPKKRVNPMKLKKLQDRLQEVELRVVELEAEIARHEAALADFKSVEETVRLTEIVSDLRRKLEAQVAEWEELSAAVEAG
jgi:ATP-binding cassette, subfamily F, member 3